MPRHRATVVSALLVFAAALASAQPQFKMPRREPSFAESLMEALEPPAGIETQGGGSDQSASHATASRTLTTAKSLDDLLAFYEEKFAARGWNDGSRHVEQGVAFLVVRFADTDVGQVLALLVIAETDAAKGAKRVALQAFPVSIQP